MDVRFISNLPSMLLIKCSDTKAYTTENWKRATAYGHALLTNRSSSYRRRAVIIWKPHRSRLKSRPRGIHVGPSKTTFAETGPSMAQSIH